MKKVLVIALLAAGIVLAYFAYNSNRVVVVNGDDSFAKVRERGFLKVATTFGAYPWSAYDPSTGQPTGGEPEIARAIAEELGVKVGFVGREDPASAVLAGEADIALYRYAAAADDQLILSEEYFTTGLAMVVRADSSATRLLDLAGKRTAHLNDPCCEDSLPLIESNGGVPVEYETIAGALSDLEAGKVEVALLEMSETAWYVRHHPILKLVGGDADHFVASGVSYGALLKREDRAMIEELNRAIARVKTRDSFRAIINKWYLFKI